MENSRDKRHVCHTTQARQERTVVHSVGQQTCSPEHVSGIREKGMGGLR